MAELRIEQIPPPSRRERMADRIEQEVRQLQYRCTNPELSVDQLAYLEHELVTLNNQLAAALGE